MHFTTALTLLFAAAWPQFGRDPGHTGAAEVAGQPLQFVAATIVMDPFTDIERAAFGDDLLVHYAAPLIDGDDVYVEIKTGNYTVGNWATQTWGVQAFRWQGSTLTPRWTVFSDWRPVPFGGGPIFEPVFQPVLANGFLFMPGVDGTVLRIDRNNGRVIDRLGGGQLPDQEDSFGGPLVADAAGNVYYNVMALDHQQPWTADIRDAWIARIKPNLKVSVAGYANLLPDAPLGSSLCFIPFPINLLPWPPTPDALPGTGPCGSQRPALNVAPAIAPDGTIYTVSRAHRNSRYAYLLALDSNLATKWAVSLRNRFEDGCEVLLPPNGTPGGCRAGALTGVDPEDNQTGSGRAIDDSSSSPLIAPDGSVFYGAYTRYNYKRGHLMHFSATGSYLGAYPFGWDVTPAIFQHGNGYSIVTKENHYDVGSYCDGGFCPNVRRPNDPLGFFVTRLDQSMRVEWQVTNPNNQEWCVNGPAIDRNGVSYINAEDGFLYAINADGKIRDAIKLTEALGQAYTPVAIDDNGRIYAEKAGKLFVVTGFTRHRAVRK